MSFSMGALSNVTVLELGSTIAGPFCARLLADFGANVIKIEDLSGDIIRSMGERYNGKSLYAASLLRNKKNVAVDLRSEKGREIVRRMIPHCDVVVENFRPGTLEKWGLGYDQLSEINPGLILARISGFGQTGPYSGWPGYGVISEATSGLRYITGDPDRPPARIATPLTDYLTGLYAAFGTMIALWERAGSGKGQVIDAALTESAFSLMEPFVASFAKLGVVAERAGSKLPGAAPNNLYPTGDGQHIHIAAWHDTLFKRLCSIMEQDLYTDERFNSVRARGKNSEELDAIIAEWTGGQALDDLEKKLQDGGIPATRIYSIADIFKDPHYKARHALVQVEDEDLGDVTLAAPVPKLSRTPGAIHHVGLDLGDSSGEILARLAGYSEQEIHDLLEEGIVV
jgi:crotonobetainyl-CoA:carnitine CoA-transferase CaiB-like acyl-CoA transferase